MPTWLLSQANSRAHRVLADALEEIGLRGYHVRVVMALDEFGPISQAELGRATELDKGDVARVVDDMAKVGMVQRRIDPTDSRRKLVSLTRHGQRQVPAIEQVLADVQAVVLAPLASRDQETLIRLLQRLQP